MAMIRCGECGKEVSDKAASCPNCGAPVDPETAIAAPSKLAFEDGHFVATGSMMVDLAKAAIEACGYRVDAASSADRTASFTTGISWGSFSGVSGTISWTEASPYRFVVSGSGKQNVKGGQVVAPNLFDEANSKARNVVNEMKRRAGAPADQAEAGGCLVLLLGLPTGAILAGQFASGLV